MADYRILITGSRNYSETQKFDNLLYQQIMDGFLTGPVHVVIVHGNCPTGADYLADTFYSRSTGKLFTPNRVLVETHPANWALHGKAAGPIRNNEMVKLGADICLAFPQPIENGPSRGTLNCAEAAIKAGITTHVYY